MENLITVSEFVALRKISGKYDVQKVTECITQAQNSDLQDLLGDFYFDLVINYEEDVYVDLIAGGIFQYEGKFFEHLGIKAILADYTYARYISTINKNLTPFGMHTKISENSQPVDRNSINDEVKQAQRDAGIKFRVTEKFILKHQNGEFSRYCENDKPNTGFRGLKISKL